MPDHLLSHTAYAEQIETERRASAQASELFMLMLLQAKNAVAGLIPGERTAQSAFDQAQTYIQAFVKEYPADAARIRSAMADRAKRKSEGGAA